MDVEAFRVHSLEKINKIEEEMAKIGNPRDKRYQTLRKRRNN